MSMCQHSGTNTHTRMEFRIWKEFAVSFLTETTAQRQRCAVKRLIYTRLLYFPHIINTLFWSRADAIPKYQQIEINIDKRWKWIFMEWNWIELNWGAWGIRNASEFAIIKVVSMCDERCTMCDVRVHVIVSRGHWINMNVNLSICVASVAHWKCRKIINDSKASHITCCTHVISLTACQANNTQRSELGTRIHAEQSWQKSKKKT